MASEQSLQTAIWQIEMGRGKMILQWISVVLLAVVLALWITGCEFHGLDKREAQDMAQLARNIARGQGFTTSVIRPLSLWHLNTYRPDHEFKFDDHPDIYNPPLYPLVLGGLFKLAGEKIFEVKLKDPIYKPEQWIIVPFNQICLFLTLLLAFQWAQQLFDRRVAVTAGLILLLSDTLWSFGISGLATTFLMLLFVAAAFCLNLADRRINPAPAAGAAPLDVQAILLVVGSAVLMGLCFLTRYSTFFLLIPMVVYAARVTRQRNPFVWASVYVLIFAAVIAPWLIRNYQVSHSLLGLAGYHFFAGDGTYRSLEINPAAAWSFHSLVREFLVRLRAIWTGTFRNLGSDICLFFFVVGLMYGFRRDDASRLRRVVVGLLLMGMIGMAVVGPSADVYGVAVDGSNLLVLLLPLVIVYGVAFFYLLLDRIQFKMRVTQALAVGVFALANVAPLLFTLLPPARPAFPYPPYCPPWTRTLAYWFDKNEVGVSDSPWSVAWYADRRCVWLPFTPEQYFQVHDFLAPHKTQFMFFTPYMLDRQAESDLVKGDYKPWAGVIHGQLPDGFPFHSVTILPPDKDQLLFAESPRWQQRPLGLSEEMSATGTNVPPAESGRTNAPAQSSMTNGPSAPAVP